MLIYHILIHLITFILLTLNSFIPINYSLDYSNDQILTDAQPASTPPYTMDPHTSKHTVNANCTPLNARHPTIR